MKARGGTGRRAIMSAVDAVIADQTQKKKKKNNQTTTTKKKHPKKKQKKKKKKKKKKKSYSGSRGNGTTGEMAAEIAAPPVV